MLKQSNKLTQFKNFYWLLLIIHAVSCYSNIWICILLRRDVHWIGIFTIRPEPDSGRMVESIRTELEFTGYWILT